MKKSIKWVLHCHHDILIEPLINPLKNRIKYIKENKPKREQPLRLRLIKVLSEEELALLPKAWDKAWKAWETWEKAWETWETWEKAWETWEKAWETWKAWEKTWKTPAMEKWHKKVCVPDCPWNGKTLFPNNE